VLPGYTAQRIDPITYATRGTSVLRQSATAQHPTNLEWFFHFDAPFLVGRRHLGRVQQTDRVLVQTDGAHSTLEFFTDERLIEYDIERDDQDQDQDRPGEISGRGSSQHNSLRAQITEPIETPLDDNSTVQPSEDDDSTVAESDETPSEQVRRYANESLEERGYYGGERIGGDDDRRSPF
jgi:hypothetical protein